MTDNNQLSPSELAKMGWTRQQRKIYVNGRYTIKFIYNVRLWVLYDRGDVALFNYDTLKAAVTWFDTHRDQFPM